MKVITCAYCNEKKELTSSHNPGTAKYCSRKCYHSDRIGKKPHNYRPELRQNRKCEFCGKVFTFVAFKSRVKANGGRFCSRRCILGYNREYLINFESKRKQKARESSLGENNWVWKGDNVGYTALHDWVRLHKGYPKKCIDCGTENGKIEWSNKDHKYKRNLLDYEARCIACHRIYDEKNNGYLMPYSTRKA